MDLPQSNDIDSTTDIWNRNTFNEPQVAHDDSDETPTINSTNPSFHPISPTTTTSHSWETSHPVVDSLAKGKTELKKDQQHPENIIIKGKRCLKQHCKLNVLEFLNAFICP